MRPLYEIDADIEAAMQFDIDEETGEIISDLSRLDALLVERETKIENVVLAYKNAEAEKVMLKAEAEKLTKRAKQTERKAESLKRWIDYALAGEKFSSPRCTVSYRSSKAVNIDDEAEFIVWAEANGHDDLLKFKTPEISKSAVKDYIVAGGSCPATIEEKQNIIRRDR